MLECLRKEPAWIICAVLRIHHWNWEKALLEQLPVAVRFEVTRLDQAGLKFTPPFLEALGRTVSDKSAAMSPRPQAQARMKVLFSRLRRRSVRTSLFGAVRL
jgi:hypothetical protein